MGTEATAATTTVSGGSGRDELAALCLLVARGAWSRTSKVLIDLDAAATLTAAPSLGSSVGVPFLWEEAPGRPKAVVAVPRPHDVVGGVATPPCAPAADDERAPVSHGGDGWRRASAAAPDPVPSEEPASASASTVVVTEDKPDPPPAEEKSEEVAAVSNGGSLETAAAAAAVSSEAAEEDGGLDDILSKLDIQVTPTLVLYGSGALVVLWVLSSVVSAIDSIPLVPKVLELIGTGYSIWFTSRYLLFKESRDELFAKFEDLKERII
uniref:Cyanobacterial aminoacyl-tRNA synthetase CAAD domain-containing protein n=1 Tax=Oryza meridionalis TaxID=40149 RepID=A0A0E0CRS6_9ORYZ